MSEQDEQVLEATNSNEELELETELDNTEDIEELKEQLLLAREAKNSILMRAKKAERELKSFLKASQPLKENSNQSTQNINTNNNAITTEDIQVQILKAQGLSEDELKYLKKLATVSGSSLIEAQSDELFASYKSKKEDEVKAEKARLGASRGSGSIKKEKGLNTPELTEAEHKELWKQKMGR